jgi:integrase
MPTNTLSDAICKGSKPKDKEYKLFDGGGLFLFVAPSGLKSWRCSYRMEGKQKTKSLGKYPAMPLSAAREARDKLKTTLQNGGDPMADRLAKRARNTKSWMSFSEACETYWSGRKDLTDGYVRNARRGLEMHLEKSLGDLHVGSITKDQLLTELNLMDSNGLYVYVRRVRMWAAQVFEWAIEHGYAKTNPAEQIRPEKAFSRRKVKHFAALDLHQMPAFLQRMAMERDLQSVLACRLLAMTWVRTTELRMMRWEEIVDDDLWIIPAGKMKRSRDHLVPISRQALNLLKELRGMTRSEYVFPAAHRIDRPMSENAILYMIGRIGYAGKMTGHGFRTVASTWANERGFNADAIERQLAHVPDDAIRSIYNRAEYLPERRRMLQEWSDWLENIG